MLNKPLRTRVIALDNSRVTLVGSDILDVGLHGHVEQFEEQAVEAVSADSGSERDGFDNETEFVFDIPSGLAREKGELSSTSDASPADLVTVGTVASTGDIQSILASLLSTVKA
jgi:hypothetical protein